MSVMEQAEVELLDAVYKRLYTVEEFDALRALPENSDRRLELVHGELVEKVTSEKHGIIALNVATAVRAYVKQHKLGYVGVEISHRPPGDRYNDRVPDISFRAARPGDPVYEAASVPQMPDLAVEVKSPSNTYKALREKAEYMIQNGAKLVWLVYPEREAVEVCTPSAEQPGALHIDTVKLDGLLTGGEVLPGLTLAVHDIFALG